jgi:hypothetical protein
MGLRSWLTHPEGPGDWDFFQESLAINPVHYGVSYVMEVTEKVRGSSSSGLYTWTTSWRSVLDSPIRRITAGSPPGQILLSVSAGKMSISGGCHPEEK